MLAAGVGGRFRQFAATDAVGRRRPTSWLALDDTTAAVETAAVAGGLVLFRAYLQAETPDEYAGRVLATSQLAVSALWLVVSAGWAP
ncbi:hypothetical protein [Umezawaea sp.]|uniref:hypothetical protein n=1 Tax=Umezawaea sp. TaxID=1955258 RepID=UPI002ED0D22F